MGFGYPTQTVKGVTAHHALVALMSGLLSVSLVSWTGVPSGAASTGLETRDAVAPLAPAAPIQWAACPGEMGYRCGNVEVPIDYAAPQRGSLSIAVIDRPASGLQSAGFMLFNPGGPGESGVQTLPVLSGQFPSPVRDRFDLVSFDERGTGASTKLNCGPSPPAATSVTPEPPPGGALPAAAVFASLASDCRRLYPQVFDHVDSIDAARDMDRIRQTLGVPTISYWGTSYGTVLGAQYARLFPRHVQSMVLDGAVVPTEPLALQAQQEAPALATALDHAFATCAIDPSCPLGPDPRASFDALTNRLATHPLPSPSDGLPITLGDLDTATLFYLSVPNFAGNYLPAVAAANRGDGAQLRALAVAFATDIDGSSDIGPLWAYTCNDANSHPGPRAAGDLARTLAKSSPPIGGFAVTYLLGGCLNWPRPHEPVRTLSYAGHAPIMVIGNTGDPNTPHVAAAILAHELGNARLATWRGWGHTWLLNGTDSACMSNAVVGYLVGSTPPRTGTVC